MIDAWFRASEKMDTGSVSDKTPNTDMFVAYPVRRPTRTRSASSDAVSMHRSPTRGKEQSTFLAHQLCQFTLEFRMEMCVSCDKGRRSGTHTIRSCSLRSSFANFWMCSESQVVIRSKHGITALTFWRLLHNLAQALRITFVTFGVDTWRGSPRSGCCVVCDRLRRRSSSCRSTPSSRVIHRAFITIDRKTLRTRWMISLSRT